MWLRGDDGDCEEEACETVLPVVAVERPEVEVVSWVLRWSGSGNVLAAAGVALLDMVKGR